MTVDFHVHSTASDGTLSPSGIAARASGFAALALTDHDNTDGVVECRAACVGQGVPFVAGVELSIEPGAGFDRFHLLGLGIDPEDVGLKALLGRVQDGRRARNARILENFARIGIDIDPAELAGYAGGGVLARPHFARWLADHGHATCVKDGFERYLLADSPAETRCYEERFRPSQEEAFRAVHEAGGLCVMAHPKFWRRAWKKSGVAFSVAERELARLKEAGLDGVEALYQANSARENKGFSRIAGRLGLIASAGSDFHGSNKPAVPFGMKVADDFIAPLLEALGLA